MRPERLAEEIFSSLKKVTTQMIDRRTSDLEAQIARMAQHIEAQAVRLSALEDKVSKTEPAPLRKVVG